MTTPSRKVAAGRPSQTAEAATATRFGLDRSGEAAARYLEVAGTPVSRSPIANRHDGDKGSTKSAIRWNLVV